MTFFLCVAFYLVGWQCKLHSMRRQATWYMRQDTQAAREWRDRHNLS